MSTIPDNPVDATKPETAPAVPTTADQRLAHGNINSAFAAAKSDIEALEPHPPRTDNPHSVTAAQAGADPTGTAAAEVAAHNASGAAHGGVEAAFGAHDGAGGATHPAATTSVAGYMSAADKTKHDGIEPGANNYSHPNHTGEVTSTGDGAQVITPNAVTTAKIADGNVTRAKEANMAANTIRLRATTAGVPTDTEIENLPDEPSPNALDSLLAQKNNGDLIKIDVGNLPTGGGGEANTSSTPSAIGGNEADINMPKVGIDLQKKKLVGGANITLTNNADNVVIAGTGGGGGGIAPDTPYAAGGILEAVNDTGGSESARTVTNVPRLDAANVFSENQSILQGGAGVGAAYTIQHNNGSTAEFVLFSDDNADSQRWRIRSANGFFVLTATLDNASFKHTALTINHDTEAIQLLGPTEIQNASNTQLDIHQTGQPLQSGRFRMASSTGFFTVTSTNDAGTPVPANPEFTIGHANGVGGQGIIVGAAALQGIHTLNVENGVFDGGNRVYSSVNPPPAGGDVTSASNTVDDEVQIGDTPAKGIKGAGINASELTYSRQEQSVGNLVTNIVSMTAAQYAALTPKVATTLYLVTA